MQQHGQQRSSARAQRMPRQHHPAARIRHHLAHAFLSKPAMTSVIALTATAMIALSPPPLPALASVWCMQHAVRHHARYRNRDTLDDTRMREQSLLFSCQVRMDMLLWVLEISVLQEQGHAEQDENAGTMSTVQMSSAHGHAPVGAADQRAHCEETSILAVVPAGAATLSSELRRSKSHSAARCMPLCASMPVSPNTCNTHR